MLSARPKPNQHEPSRPSLRPRSYIEPHQDPWWSWVCTGISCFVDQSLDLLLSCRTVEQCESACVAGICHRFDRLCNCVWQKRSCGSSGCLSEMDIAFPF
jgi:hypothetical protein